MIDVIGPEPSDDDKPRKPSAADLLVRLAMESYDLARAEDGEPFAIERGGPNVARMFRGGRGSLRAALAAAYADRHGKVPPAQAIVDALAVLEGRALGSPRQRLALRADRIAPDLVVVDMADETGRAILVGPDGWSIVDRSPVTFRRSELTGALPTPVAGSLDVLAKLVNVAPADVPLVLAHQVAALLGVPVPIILLRGPAGAAKTTAARTLSTCIDPSPAPVRSVPRDPESWAVTAGGSFVVVLDNVDTVPPWLSDALCRAVTGEGYLRRALYTDGAIAVVAFRRAIILTGIDPGAMRGDLADRLVAVDLEAIGELRREEDAAMAARLEAAHPALLGAVLDLTAAVLACLPDVHLARLPRMADYGRILATVDAILGTDALTRYMDQRGDLQREAAEGDRIGAATIKYMVSRDDWTGTATELLEALTPERPPKDWPGTGRALAASLRRLVNPLAAAGIVVAFGERSGKARHRLVRLERAEGADANAPMNPPRTEATRADAMDGRPRTEGETPSASSAMGDPSTNPADGADANGPGVDANGIHRPPHRPPSRHVSTHENGAADGADGADGLFASVLGPDAPTVQGHDPDLYRAHALAIRLVDGVAVCDTCTARPWT